MSYICIEAESGLVIGEQNADEVRPPASMIKMMQMLLVAEGVREGSWTLGTPITVSKKAEGMGGTQVYLKEGEIFTVNQLMEAVAVASANDAALAVAEGLWGSEDAYKKRMNERAAELGMASSRFFSVHGLPPDPGQEFDRTTARDMARLAQFCVLDPLVLQWSQKKDLQFRPADAVSENTNKLLQTFNGCDGLKTGYIRAAGFCVTATAVRDGIRLIAVVMGSHSNSARFAAGARYLEDSFAQIHRKRLVAKGEPFGPPVPVANCETARVRLAAADDLWVVVRKDDDERLALTPDLPAMLQPPIPAGASVGELRAELAGKTLGSVTLLAPADLTEAGWPWKMVRSVYALQ